MAHRYMSIAEQSAILTGIAAYVAGYLTPEGFTYTPPIDDEHNHVLVGPNEAKLYISMEGDTKGDRIYIGGSFHIGKDRFGNPGSYVRPDNDPGTISVALKRGEEAIAREIRMRYLPKYLPALAQARQKRDAQQAYRTARHENLQKLQNLGGDMRKLDIDAERGYLHIGEVYGHIEATNDSASLELRCLTIQQAEAIIKLLKKIQ